LELAGRSACGRELFLVLFACSLGQGVQLPVMLAASAV